jgi:predicted nuclease of predicted toxin-antitoxin system
VKFLLDQNLSPDLVEILNQAGHTTTHVRALGISEATDYEVLAEAKRQGAVLVSADTDFGELLAHSNAAGPSVILLRRQQGRRAAEVAALILANLNAVADDLESGAFVVLDQDRIRVRSLPFRPED